MCRPGPARCTPHSPSMCSPERSSAGKQPCPRRPASSWTRSRWGSRSETTGNKPGKANSSHHSDAGSQYTSFQFTQHLIDSGVDASIGTVGDALDNALAESLIGLYKTELIKPRGPWHNIREVDVATAAWVDWYNNRRLHGACQGRPPVEFETLYELGDLISLVA